MDHGPLLAATKEWIEADPDPVTREELQGLIDAGSWHELGDRMNGSLDFGTAGLRGRVEAGSNRMNCATVIRTSRGLADYLVDRHGAGSLVVVGRDARQSSERFMHEAVAVFTAAGLRVSAFPLAVPTPLAAYAARKLGAKAAVVITASHNPPADNGYKVYDANAVQIVPPVDRSIAAAIDRVGPARDVPRSMDGDVTSLGDDVFEAYLADVAAFLPPIERAPLKIVYTPLHGVGGRFVLEALRRAGHVDVVPVADQFEPDGNFPTVAFPNPEEAGALDLALELAHREGADLVVANDPDTDRLAVAVPDGPGYRSLTGNQIGVLLADHLLASLGTDTPIVINSIVSTPMLESIAAHRGARFATTLTGFKWIWNAALDLEADRVGRFVFGFEEALGYSVGQAVRDKDGISAAVAFADLASAAKQAGGSVLARLEDLHRTHGLWVSTQLSVVREGSDGRDEIAAAMSRLATSQPSELAGMAVTGFGDFNLNADKRPRYLPATNLLAVELGDNGRVLVRPSGTEPKLKIYVDLVQPVAGDVDESEAALLSFARAAAADMATFLGLG